MKQERVVTLLLALNSKRTGYRSGWVEGPCPLAPWTHANGVDAHPSFGILSSSKKKSICKCLSCGYGGDLLDLMFKLKSLLAKDPDERYRMKDAVDLIANEFEDIDICLDTIPEYGDFEEKAEVVFPEVWLKSFRSVFDFEDPLAYCCGRDVSQKTLDFFDVRYDPLQHRVCFPFRNTKGELMGVQGRSLEENPELRYYQYGYKGKRNSVWMGEDYVDFDLPVVLCEGPFDLTSIFRVYQNVVASFTSGLSVEKLKRLGDASEIITFYDYGAGGEAARAKIQQVLSGAYITHVVPTKLEDDAGNMLVEAVAGRLAPHVKLNYFG